MWERIFEFLMEDNKFRALDKKKLKIQELFSLQAKWDGVGVGLNFYSKWCTKDNILNNVGEDKTIIT